MSINLKESTFLLVIKIYLMTHQINQIVYLCGLKNERCSETKLRSKMELFNNIYVAYKMRKATKKYPKHDCYSV